LRIDIYDLKAPHTVEADEMEIGAPLRPLSLQPQHHEDSSDEDGEGQKRAAPDTAGPSHQGEAKRRKKK
jgi:hypothetical protein